MQMIFYITFFIHKSTYNKCILKKSGKNSDATVQVLCAKLTSW